MSGSFREPAPRGGALILTMIAAAGVLNYADRQIIAVLKPLLASELHWSDLDYGRITAVFQLASAVALLGSGWLVDRIGWRRANPLAVGAWSLAAMAHAFVRSLLAFTLARAALGATEALATPTAIKTIAAVYPRDRRSLALGIMNAANTAGAVVTPILVPRLALKIGWADTFLVTGGAGLAWVLIWWLSQAGRAEILGETAALPPEAGAFWKALKSRSTWAIAGAKVLSDQVWWLLLFWTPDLLHRLFGLSLVAVGELLAFIYAAAGAGSLLGGWASSRLLAAGWSVDRTRKTVLLVLAFAATPVILVVFVKNALLAAGLLGLTLAAHQGFSVNIFALVADVAPERRVASVVSIGALCGNLGGMVILQTAGIVLEAGLGYGPLLGLASVSYLLAVGWIQLLLPTIVPAEAAPG